MDTSQARVRLGASCTPSLPCSLTGTHHTITSRCLAAADCRVLAQVCLQRAQELLLGIEALVPIVKALQCVHLRPPHWERLQALVQGLDVGPESDVTLLQLTGVHVRGKPII